MRRPVAGGDHPGLRPEKVEDGRHPQGKSGAAALSEAGTHGLILNCLRGNPALGFYRRLGGSVVGERRDALENAEIVEDILFFDEPAFMA